MKILKILSALLSYPTPELISAFPEMRECLRMQSAAPEAVKNRTLALINDLSGRDLWDMQEAYVALFDRSRLLSLHLFEHIHGESRARGQAMVDLRAEYFRLGLFPDPSELPDFLPMLLECASLLPKDKALELLNPIGALMATLEIRHSRRQSPYAAAFGALAALIGAQLESAQRDQLQNEPVSGADDLAALDKAWLEEEVKFEKAQSIEPRSSMHQTRRAEPGNPVECASPPCYGTDF